MIGNIVWTVVVLLAFILLFIGMLLFWWVGLIMVVGVLTFMVYDIVRNIRGSK